jgi:hypothetical protein
MVKTSQAAYAFTPEELRVMGYVAWRQFETGEWAAVMPMTFGKGRICFDLSPSGYEDMWCFESLGAAVDALQAWDLAHDTEPSGWFRHPLSGRRRPNGNAGEEFVMP